MEFPQAGSGPNRKQIIDALRNTAQSASNMVAENLSVPVDAIAWALRKAGVPVDKPMFGSDWMKEKGVTPTVPEGAAKVIGDTIGMISPMGLTKQGAKAMIDAGSKLKGLPVGLSIKDVSGAYPQAEALALAQQRAALPVSQGGLGLPPNNTAMDRAKAMGFDADVFHGTNKDIQQFAPKQYNKGDKKTMLFDVGTHGAFNPATANDYAMASQFGEKYARGLASGMDVSEGLSPVVYPLKMNTSKMLDATVPFSDEVTNKILQKGDEFFSSRKRKNVQLKDVEPSMFLQELQSKMGRPKFEKFIKNDLGSDAVQYEWGGPNIVNMNPDNIRSRFAAFDPFRKTAAIAATMGVAAPDLLAQERNK